MLTAARTSLGSAFARQSRGARYLVGGLRVAVTEFGLATIDSVSNEPLIGSAYHISPECQGVEYAPSGYYSPMFNDIWSLGVILLNLLTGRSPWKAATPGDPTFQAYLRDPGGFLPTILPISAQVNDTLVRMLDVNWCQRANLREVRHAIERVSSFYSEDAIFEGSTARHPWEFGTDIDSASESSGSSVEDSGPALPSLSRIEEQKKLGKAWKTTSSRLSPAITEAHDNLVGEVPAQPFIASFGNSSSNSSSLGITDDGAGGTTGTLSKPISPTSAPHPTPDPFSTEEGNYNPIAAKVARWVSCFSSGG